MIKSCYSSPFEHQNGEVLRNAGKISYSCLLELFKKKLKSLGFPSDSFALHRLWAGGATAAANAGVLTGFSKGMVDGGQKMPKMGTFRITWRPG